MYEILKTAKKYASKQNWELFIDFSDELDQSSGTIEYIPNFKKALLSIGQDFFKNPLHIQQFIVGHELGHILQYYQQSGFSVEMSCDLYACKLFNLNLNQGIEAILNFTTKEINDVQNLCFMNDAMLKCYYNKLFYGDAGPKHPPLSDRCLNLFNNLKGVGKLENNYLIKAFLEGGKTLWEPNNSLNHL